MKKYIIILKEDCPIELRQDLDTLIEIFVEENHKVVEKYETDEV